MPAHLAIAVLPDLELLELLGSDELEIESVVQIVAVIGNLVGQIGDLRFQRWAGVSLVGARRRGIVNNTPSIPPAAQIETVIQNGKPCQWPIINRPGITKIIDDNVPAADACVCTILFSRILPARIARSTAIEITAAGIDDEKVKPTLRPR